MTPFYSRHDATAEMWFTFADEVARVLRRRANDTVIREALEVIRIRRLTDAEVAAGLAELEGIDAIPSELVTRKRRAILFLADEAPERRALFAARREAVDAAGVKVALAAAVDAQARSCMQGRPAAWLDDEAVYAAACALSALVPGVGDWRLARERLAGGVRDRICELATAATRAA